MIHILKMKSKNVIYYLSILSIIIISFLFFSYNFYPLLNSDDALNVLMAHYYKLPNDIYCWGQDRGGTLIPLISQLFITVFNLSALTSVSISTYIILTLGFFGFASLIKNKFLKILFAIIWFLPFQRFIDILRFPIGIEYSLIGIAIYFINKIAITHEIKNLKKHLFLIITALTLIISVWVSDLSIITISIVLLSLIAFKFFENKKISIDKTSLLYCFGAIAIGYLFIHFAKEQTPIKSNNYLSINAPYQIKEGLEIIINSFKDVLTFKTNEVLVSIYTYFVIIFTIVFLFYVVKKKLISQLISNKWIIIFIVDCLVIFTTILLSRWVLLNGMGRWYFVASYISLSLAIILSLDNIIIKHKPKLLTISLLIIVIIGAISPLITMKYVRPKTLKPMVEVVGELQTLGEIGVIAEFWNSYIISCRNPELIKVTPHDKSDVRNKEMIEMVFERDKIYIIKDMWMDNFPDTLTQFGHTLIKDSVPFNLGGCDICKYRLTRANN